MLKINYQENIAEIQPLSPEDAVLDYGQLGNFSLAGFEMVLTRYVSTYIITYYLPSGKLLLETNIPEQSQGRGNEKQA